jgi:hypothetical protein
MPPQDAQEPIPMTAAACAATSSSIETAGLPAIFM